MIALNTQQLAAITRGPGHAAVIAAPGAGKTTVLVERIAFLIEQGVLPDGITAISFTNKAAHEIGERLARRGIEGVWSGTFHKFGLEMLKSHGASLGLPTKLSILDASGSLSAVRQALKACGITPSRSDGTGAYPARIAELIERAKGRGEHPEELSDAGELALEAVRGVYSAYRDACQRDGLVDFADLLLLSTDLLRSNHEAQRFYSERAEYLLVDEFQDVSAVQLALVRLIAPTSAFIVCDPHQSIYSWRGANPDVIEQFVDEFAAETHRIDLNYRSAAGICALSSAIVGTTLRPTNDDPGHIAWFEARSEYAEAERIAAHIAGDLERGAGSIAVLCRSNAQIRVLEQVFATRQIPNRVIGNNSFWTRVEVKICTALLQLSLNPLHQPALEYLIEQAFHPKFTPCDGKLGATSLERLAQHAAANNVPLLETLDLGEAAGCHPPAVRAARWLYTAALPALYEHANPVTTLQAALETWGYRPALEERTRAEDDETSRLAKSRLEGLNEFMRLAQEIGDTERLVETLMLQRHDFDDESECNLARVELLTVHAAKGAEWDFVYVPGLNEGTYPAAYSNSLEEERRLLYVAVTRARKGITLSRALERKIGAQWVETQISRLIAPHLARLASAGIPHRTLALNEQRTLH